MSDEKNAERPAVIQAVMTLKKREFLTPHYIRITLTGEDVPKFANTRRRN